MAVQELKINFEQLSYQLHGQKVELDLLLERLNTLEKNVSKLSSNLPSPLESRVCSLEKAHKALITDFQSLKKHIDTTNSSLAQCQKKLSDIDKQLSSDIKTLKNSLNSMLALLGEEGSDLYTVQPGDSLGKIALQHKTTTKNIKDLNNLKSDTIIVGQKLKLK